ncbi:MAG: TraR/DksA family transcriptional regulator [Syntrophobacteraceae bacterium]
MSKEEVLFLRSILLGRRTDMLERVRKIAAAWREMEERSIEMQEEAQRASIARPYDKLDETGKLEIQQIDLALTKMSLGDYGTCESCGDDIAPKRLEVIPWARLCVDCAREHERKPLPLPGILDATVSAKLPDEYEGMANEQVAQAVYKRLQGNDQIEVEEVRVSIIKEVLYLDGSVPTEHEREILIEFLTDSLSFSTIVDRLEVHEPGAKRRVAYSDRENVEEPLFYNDSNDPDDFQEEPV